MIKVIYNKVCGRCVQSEPLTSGMVGQPIHFEYSHDFDGLAVTAVFTDGKNTVDVVNPGNECIIPHEVLTTVGAIVKVGIYAVKGDELVIPTIYAHIGVVLKGADPSGDVSIDPTLPIWAQTQALIGNLSQIETETKDSLVAAINEVKQTTDRKANAADLAPVATSGSYSDLSDKPTIPSVPTATIEANAAARHTHNNKKLLDSITEALKTAWNTASEWVSTNGANVLSHLSDGVRHITATERSAWNDKQDKLIAGDNITISEDGKTISATGGGGGGSTVELDTTLTQSGKAADAKAVGDALAGKQNTISDLEAIRTGAAKGATALQSVPNTYRTAAAQDVIDNGLSDRVSAIEGKEAGWNSKYSKPADGIPKADLANDVQASLGKADAALQEHQSLAAYRTAAEQNIIDNTKQDKLIAGDNITIAADGKTISATGGGSSVQPDWNQNDATQPDYVKNRPFYIGNPVETVLVEESTVSFDAADGIYMGELKSTFSATVGETYKISWDSTVYECTCVEIDSRYLIGNLSITGEGSDTGEPFLMMVDNGRGIMIGTADTSASHTFSISGSQTPIVKIPAKYIDKDASGYIVIHKNNTMTEQEAQNYANAISKRQVVFIIWGSLCISTISVNTETNSTGVSVVVLYVGTPNGESYTIVQNSKGLFKLIDRKLDYAKFPNNKAMGDDSSEISIDKGKIRIGSSTNYSGVGTTDTLFYVQPNGIKSKSFEVLGNGEAVAPALILYSSTANSTKKFKITVDDTGALSATEVTE